MIDAALCAFEAPKFLFFSSNVPTLLYFSHFPALFFSLAFAAYILLRSRGKLEAYILFISLIPFSLWVLFDLILFASNRSDVVLFFWSLLVLIEPLTHFGLWYLQRVMSTGRDISFHLKLLMMALFVPLFVIIGSGIGLPGFDTSVCIAVEATYLHYAYILEFFFIFLILVDAIRYAHAAVDIQTRRKVLYFGGTITLFLLLFSTGNLIGSLTDNWVIAQAGLFGSPIFIGLMAYLLVRFSLFNIKVIGAQMLVVVLWGTIFMLFFLRSIETVRIVVVLALAFVTILGFYLIRGVMREIAQRQQIQALADNLKKANDRLTELDKMKSQFLSIASHDMRAPLTIIRNFMSLLLDGTYGKLPAAAEEGSHRVFQTATDMTKLVDSYLDVTRIEQGRMKYDMVPLDLARVVTDSVAAFKSIAEAKGLSLTYTGDALNLKGDAARLREVFGLLIDNSIKYTPKGNIQISISKSQTENMVRVTIKDTGIGMSPATIGKLFKMFSPGDNAKKINPSSSGVGLYVVKAIVEAHKGKVWAESEGEGKGSTFIVELPVS